MPVSPEVLELLRMGRQILEDRLLSHLDADQRRLLEAAAAVAARRGLEYLKMPRPKRGRRVSARPAGAIDPETQRAQDLALFRLNPGATREEIRRAYHALARETHPDRPGGDVRKFLAAKEAFDRLSASVTR